MPKALRSSCQEALLPAGLRPRQGMVHTPSSSRCNAVTVAGPPAVSALLHRSLQRPLRAPLRRWPPALSSTVTAAVPGAVAEQLTQCRGGMDPHRQDSRRRGPPASVPGSCQPGPRAKNSGVQLSAFLHLRTGELVHPIGVSTACPGTGTGHGAASSVCPPTLHHRASSDQLHEPHRESSTGVGGGCHTAGLSRFRAHTVGGFI